jgi:hypothetical protein
MIKSLNTNFTHRPRVFKVAYIFETVLIFDINISQVSFHFFNSDFSKNSGEEAYA